MGTTSESATTVLRRWVSGCAAIAAGITPYFVKGFKVNGTHFNAVVWLMTSGIQRRWSRNTSAMKPYAPAKSSEAPEIVWIYGKFVFLLFHIFVG